MKKLLMEFLGAFFFILTIAIKANPIAIAAMLMAWLYIGGFISGGHYNPAVSLGVALRGLMDHMQTLRYMLAQVLGGFAAFAMAHFLKFPVSIPAPGAHVSMAQAFIVEVLLSFVFVSVVLTVATWEKFKPSYIFGFAIAFTIPALAALGGPISGGLFNPAIALGASLFGITHGVAIVWQHLFMYVIGALLGGALAAYAFRYFMLDEQLI